MSSQKKEEALREAVDIKIKETADSGSKVDAGSGADAGSKVDAGSKADAGSNVDETEPLQVRSETDKHGTVFSDDDTGDETSVFVRGEGGLSRGLRKSSSADSRSVADSSSADSGSLDEYDKKLLGKVISERYLLEQVIGRGGMGTVFKAKHVATGRCVAVKVMSRDLSDSIKARERFQTEAKAAAMLNHERLVAVHDFGITDDDRQYLVMDYQEGENLAELIHERRSLSLYDLVEIFDQIAVGLSYAHSMGVLHRDLKPSNIIVSRANDGSIKARILDFGIAKIVDDRERTAQHLTRTGEIFGSPYYMSPEQCSGAALNRRSDLYSLGCMMFEALCGRVPFSGPTSVETMYKHMNEPVPYIQIKGMSKKADDEINKVFSRCLAKNPSERYENAQALRYDLRSLRAAIGKEKDGAASASVAKSVNISFSGGQKSDSTGKHFGPRKLVMLVMSIFFVIFAGVYLFQLTSMLQSAGKVDHAHVNELHLLSEKYLAESRFEEALPFCEKAFNLTNRDDESLENARSLHNLASSLSQKALVTDDAPERISLQKNAIKYAEDAYRIAQAKAADRRTLDLYRGELGGILLWQAPQDANSLRKAETLLITTVQSERQYLNHDDLQMFQSLADLAGYYWTQGRYEDAARLTLERRGLAEHVRTAEPEREVLLKNRFAGSWSADIGKHLQIDLVQNGNRIYGTYRSDYNFRPDRRKQAEPDKGSLSGSVSGRLARLMVKDGSGKPGEAVAVIFGDYVVFESLTRSDTLPVGEVLKRESGKK